MSRNRHEDLIGLLERACRDTGALAALLADRDGLPIARVGEVELLPDAARQLLAPDGLRRVALALDEDDPEYAPPPAETDGAHVFFTSSPGHILGLAVVGELIPPHLRRLGREALARVESHLDQLRQQRRRNFLGHRLLVRVVDKTYVMSAEVRRMLELLCDGVLDLEEALAAGAETSAVIHRFRETLDELVAWPKRAGVSFQSNLEALRESIDDLRPEDLTKERLEALIAGLEMTIESWPLP